jgi:arginyl-tRNA synthetase
MNIVEQIKKDLALLCENIGIEAQEISLDIPTDGKFGDYSTNIALRLANKTGEKPLELAQKIIKSFLIKKPDYLASAQVAGPGFINFYLSKDFLISQLDSLLTSSRKIDIAGQTARLAEARSKRVVIEFTDPNPFKEFHIGHLYSNIVGESLARISQWQGNDVKRLCYQGDVGLHVAKAIYGMQTKLSGAKSASGGLKEENKSVSELEKEDLKTRMRFMGQSYALGDSAYNDDSEAKSQIIEINKKIYAKDNDILDLYKKGREWSLEYFNIIYARLGTKFDKFYFESEAGEKGIEIVKEHIKDGIFEESEGAVIFDGEKYGLHKRVFINSLGLPTYEAKELGLAIQKYDDFAFDSSVIVTAKEVSDYFKVLFKAISLINPEIAEKMTHVGHGFVKLPEGKMSSRTGNVITGEWLLDEAVSKVKKQFPEMDSETAEKVGVGAVKYSLLKSGIGGDVVFNFDESISLEGNSGPYLQYTNVRCLSVLRKVGKDEDLGVFDDSSISSEEESLLKKLVKFEDQFIFTKDFSQSTLCTYLYELASLFNLFYQKNPILNSENESFRLKLTKVTSQVLTLGLHLLGIAAPGQM